MFQTNKKVKICLVLHSLMGGGAERFMINLASNLNRSRFEIVFILLNKKGDYADLIPNDIKVVDLQFVIPALNEWKGFSIIFRLSRVFKDQKPHIIFSTLGYTNLLTILAVIMSRIKVPVLIRETSLISKWLKDDPALFLKKFIYKIFYSNVALILAPSKEMIVDLQNFLGLKRINTKVIPNFVDSVVIDKKMELNPDNTRLNLKFDRPIFVSAGHLEGYKGFNYSIKAFSRVHKKTPSYYWILGKGSQEDALRNLAEELGISDSVRFLGFQDNPYWFFKKADIFILSSQFEGFPNVLLEAMYCGLPSVVTKCNQLVQDMILEGKCGLLASVDHVDELADAMTQLLSNGPMREQMGQYSKEFCRHYDYPKIVQQYEETFMSFAKQ